MMTSEKEQPLGTLNIGDVPYQTRLTSKFLGRKKIGISDPGLVLCAIPGVIQKIYVSEGQTVRSHDPLLVLEAMKMQNDILAPLEGTIKRICVEVGQQVGKGETLMEMVSAWNDPLNP